MVIRLFKFKVKKIYFFNLPTTNCLCKYYRVQCPYYIIIYLEKIETFQPIPNYLNRRLN